MIERSTFGKLFHRMPQTTDQLAELCGGVRIGTRRLVRGLGPRLEQHTECETDREVHELRQCIDGSDIVARFALQRLDSVLRASRPVVALGR